MFCMGGLIFFIGCELTRESWTEKVDIFCVEGHDDLSFPHQSLLVVVYL